MEGKRLNFENFENAINEALRLSRKDAVNVAYGYTFDIRATKWEEGRQEYFTDDFSVNEISRMYDFINSTPLYTADFEIYWNDNKRNCADTDERGVLCEKGFITIYDNN